MTDVECPHPECEGSEKTFASESGMKTHYGMQHEGSLAKKEATCSTDGCTNTFEYYPSAKSGELCEKCVKRKNYDLTKYDAETLEVECDHCGKQKYVTKTEYEKYENHFCNNKCQYSSSRTEIECENCGSRKTVQSWKADRGRKFCGFDCFVDSNRSKVSCSQCGDSVEVIQSRIESSSNIFCNNSCYQKYRSENGRVEVECDICSNTMSRTKYRVDKFSGVFCSDECQIESMKNREKVVCSECGTEFQKRPSEIERTNAHFCSRPCRSRFYRSEDSLKSYGEGWISARREVRQRDDYACQICGKDKTDLGKNPSAHHITPVNYFIETDGFDKWDAHYTENLVLLCEHHHTKVEFGVIDLAGNISDELAEELELEDPVEES